MTREVLGAWLRSLLAVTMIVTWIYASVGDDAMFWPGYLALSGLLCYSAWQRAHIWAGQSSGDDLRPSAPPLGGLQQALEPFGLPLLSASVGLWMLTLARPQGSGLLLMAGLYLWAFPLAGALLPTRVAALIGWGVMAGILGSAYPQPGLAVLVVGIVLLWVRSGQAASLQLNYSPLHLIVDLVGFGLVAQLASFANRSPFGEPSQPIWAWSLFQLFTCLHGRNLGVLWCFPTLFWAWWFLLRMPLINALALLRSARWQRLVGLLLGLQGGWLLQQIERNSSPIYVVVGAALGLLSAWRARPALDGYPHRRTQIRLRLGLAYVATAVVAVGWDFGRTFPFVPEVALPQLAAWPAPYPVIDEERPWRGDRLWDNSLGESTRDSLAKDLWHTYLSWRKRPRPEQRPQMLRCLEALGDYFYGRGNHEQAVTVCLERLRLQDPGDEVARELVILVSQNKAPRRYREIVQQMKALATPPIVAPLDAKYQEWQANLLLKGLPFYCQDFERRVGAQFYAGFRAAAVNGTEFPPTAQQIAGHYPGATQSLELADDLNNLLAERRAIATHHQLLWLLAAVQLYREEHGQYPDRLEALKTPFVNFLNLRRGFVYARRGKGYEVKVPGDRYKEIWP